jgi:nucleotide-binding universal stress UspA family protein
MNSFPHPNPLFMKPVKNILVATDLTKDSDALHIYASELARQLGAKVFVLHSYFVPIPASDSNFVDVSFYEKETTTFIREKFEQIEKDFLFSGTQPHEFITRSGDIEKNIDDLVKKKEIDLIMMGTNEPNGLIEIFGSHTSRMATKSNVPVLVIPTGLDFKSFKKILYACDLKKVSNNLNVLDTISQKYNAEIHVLTIENKLHIISRDEEITEKILDELFENTNVKHFHKRNDDIEEGIISYVRENDVDLLVATPHHHSFWHRITEKSITKRLLFHARVPLLILPE